MTYHFSHLSWKLYQSRKEIYTILVTITPILLPKTILHRANKLYGFVQPSEAFAMCTKKEQLVHIVASLNNTLANVLGSLMYEKIKSTRAHQAASENTYKSCER